MANSGNYSKDNELAKEFSTLIGNIAAEVTNQVAKNTVLKDVKELQSVSNGMQVSAPRILQTLKQANQELMKTKKASVDVLTDFNAEVQKSQKLTQKAMENFYAAINTTTESNQKKVADSIEKMTTAVESSVKTVNEETDKTLAKYTSLFEDQNTLLKENLEAADEKYNQLSTGSYQAYRDAMNAQTKEIVESLRQTLEQNAKIAEANKIQMTELLKTEKTDILNCSKDTENTILEQLRLNNDKAISNFNKILKRQEEIGNQINLLLQMIDQQNKVAEIDFKELYRSFVWIFIIVVLILFAIVGIRVYEVFFV